MDVEDTEGSSVDLKKKFAPSSLMYACGIHSCVMCIYVSLCILYVCLWVCMCMYACVWTQCVVYVCAEENARCLALSVPVVFP